MLIFRYVEGLTLALLMGLGIAHAETRNCDVELFKAKKSEATSSITDLFQLSLVDKEHYDDFKASSSGKYAYYFEGGFDGFKKKLDKDIEESRYHYQNAQARNFVSSTIDDNALAAYKACLQSLSELSVFLSKSPSERLITIGVHFAPKTNPPTPNPLQIQYIGVKPFGAGASVGDGSGTITDNPPIGSRAYLFERLPNQEFVAVVQLRAMGLVADQLALPIPPKVTRVPEVHGLAESGTGSISQAAGSNVGAQWGPRDTCVNADAGWTIVSGSQEFSASSPCVGKTLSVSNESKVCYTVVLSVNAGQSCSSSWSVQAKATRLKEVFE